MQKLQSMPLKDTLDPIITSIRNGDKAAENKLAEVVTPELMKITNHLGRRLRVLDEHLQEDIVQNSMIAILRKAKDPEHHIEHPTAYFQRVVKNSAISILRKSQRGKNRHLLFSELDDPNKRISFSSTIVARESSKPHGFDDKQLGIILEAIAHVEQQHPNLGYKMILEDYILAPTPSSIKFISEELGIPPDTAKTRKMHAKDFLYKTLQSITNRELQDEKQELLILLNDYYQEHSANNKSRLR